MAKVCDCSGPVPCVLAIFCLLCSDNIPSYWNYTADYKNMPNSPIFSSDPVVGFGSHGRTAVNVSGLAGYKVDNGAFANMKVCSSLELETPGLRISSSICLYPIISLATFQHGRP